MNSLSDNAQKLHDNLVGGDPTASAKIAELILPKIVLHLSSRYSGSDEHLRMEAAADTLMDYLGNPSKYDPSKSKLISYLKVAADRDMMNLLAKEGRREKKIEATDPVELYESGGNKEVEGVRDSVVEEIVEAAAAKELESFIRSNFEDTVDRELARLLLDEVRETAEYVSALDIGEMDELSQRAEVKRHKDRIKAKLKRLQRTKQHDE